MSETQSSLSRLVVFMVCLAIAGCLAGGIYYYVAVLPVPEKTQVPDNSACYNTCTDGCDATLNACTGDGKACLSASQACERTCSITCACSDCKDVCKVAYVTCRSGPVKSTTCQQNLDRCEDACPC
ncbi:MAG: hypothetical protein LUQ71_06300 [Methanoregula sp.]|nr:hypothetical protein [Methanoregula sp.]